MNTLEVIKVNMKFHSYTELSLDHVKVMSEKLREAL